MTKKISFMWAIYPGNVDHSSCREITAMKMILFNFCLRKRIEIFKVRINGHITHFIYVLYGLFVQ